MSEKTEIVLSLGIVVVLMIIGFAIADHIKNAQKIEIQTPYYKIISI